MFKSIIVAILIASSTFLSGCSSFISNYAKLYPEQKPTFESISQSNGKQIYKNTVFYKEDFKSDGTLKNINDYNYALESSPCTVLENKYVEQGLYDRQYYIVKKDNKDFKFVCQFNNSKYTRDERRLYLVGSFEECKSRTFDYNVSILNGEIKSLGKQCNPNKTIKTKFNYEIEMSFNESYKKGS